MTLPDELILGMVDALAARRGDRRPHYTAHSHELTMNGYRADVDVLLKYIEAQGYKVVRAALDDQDAALRDRCERLRRYAVAEPIEVTGLYDWYDLHPGDLDDDLIPRGGDE